MRISRSFSSTDDALSRVDTSGEARRSSREPVSATNFSLHESHAVVDRALHALQGQPLARQRCEKFVETLEGTPPDVQSAGIRLLGSIAWLVSHGGALDNVTEHLPGPESDALSVVQRLLDRCIEDVLNDRFAEVANSGSLSSGAVQAYWDAATFPARLAGVFADALTAPDGTFDPTAINALRTLVTSPEYPYDRQIRGLSGKHWVGRFEQLAALGPEIDRLSAEPPLDSKAALLLAEACGCESPDRRQRAGAILSTLFGRVRQLPGMGICWLISPKTIQHEQHPERVLQSLGAWFDTGLMPLGVGGPVQGEELQPVLDTPDPLIEVLNWKLAPEIVDELLVSSLLPPVLHALRRAEGPDGTDEYWMDCIRTAAKECGEMPRLGELIQGMLKVHMRSNPRPEQGDGRMQDLYRICVNAIARQKSSLLLAAWQHAGVHLAGDTALRKCWKAVRGFLGKPPDKATRCFMQALSARLAETGQFVPDELGAVEDNWYMSLHLPDERHDDQPVRVTDDATLGELLAQLAQTVDVENLARMHGVDAKKIEAGRAKIMSRLRSPKFAKHVQSHVSMGGDRSLTAWHRTMGATSGTLSTSSFPVVFANARRSRTHVQVFLLHLSVGWSPQAQRNGRDALTSLRNVLGLLRDFDRQYGGELQETLSAHGGNLPIGAGAHNFTLTPHEPGLLSGWRASAESRSSWIARQVVSPAEAALRKKLDADVARSFVLRLLHSLDSTGDVRDHEKWCDSVIAKARCKEGPAGKVYRLSSLVEALKSSLKERAGSQKKQKVNLDDLTVGLLNQPEIQGSFVPYADPNWYGSNRMCFAYSPVTRRVEHFDVVEKIHWLTGQPLIAVQAHSRPFF